MRVKEKWLPKLASLSSEPSDRWGIVTENDQERWIIEPTSNLDQQDIALICATHNNALSETRVIEIGSIVNKDLEPHVQITLGTETIQLSIVDARIQHRFLGETIEAAISDGILCRFMAQVIGINDTAMILAEFRRWRDVLTGNRPPEINAESHTH